ncbi:MAG: GntR family transcriptional regulator [Armatimonadetes bacterium]|nr:GntR family transcriptional regulator [Armatimonadota bacterium]
MRLAVDRNGQLSLGEQLRAQLKYLILSGDLQAGERLPPVRTLAGFLRVNRNTVARVYQDLTAEGYLESTVGRGTFVAARRPAARGGEAIAHMIDRLLDAAAAAGLTVEDVASALVVRGGRKRRPAARPRLGFVECNASDLAYFVNALSREVAVPITPVLLADVEKRWHDLDLVATTFFHVEEVRRRVPGREVIGLMAVPDFATLARVAHLPKDRTVALVCATAEGVQSKERSIWAVGIRRRRLLTATLRDGEPLRRTLAHADVVLASPKVLERIAADIPPRAEVVPFGSVLSEGAVALLHARIRTWQRRNMDRSGGRAWAGFA